MIGFYGLLHNVELFVLISFVFSGTTPQAVNSYSQHTVIYRKLATLYLLPDHLLLFPSTRKAPRPYFALLYTGWTFKLVSLQRALLLDICVFAWIVFLATSLSECCEIWKFLNSSSCVCVCVWCIAILNNFQINRRVSASMTDGNVALEWPTCVFVLFLLLSCGAGDLAHSLAHASHVICHWAISLPNCPMLIGKFILALWAFPIIVCPASHCSLHLFALDVLPSPGVGESERKLIKLGGNKGLIPTLFSSPSDYLQDVDVTWLSFGGLILFSSTLEEQMCF